jgi:hypothetical protein
MPEDRLSAHPDPPAPGAPPAGRARSAAWAQWAAWAAVAAAALYLTVWLHELAHAATGFALGCKPDGWTTTGTTWYLAGSNAGALDERCVEAHGRLAVTAVAGAGIACNLALMLAAVVAARRLSGDAAHRSSGDDAHRSADAKRHALLLPAVFLALTAGSEAISYLVFNGFAPRADMAPLIAASGIPALAWCLAGVLIAALAVLALRRPLASGAAAGVGIRLLLAALLLLLAIAAYRAVADPRPDPPLGRYPAVRAAPPPSAAAPLAERGRHPAVDRRHSAALAPTTRRAPPAAAATGAPCRSSNRPRSTPARSPTRATSTSAPSSTAAPRWSPACTRHHGPRAGPPNPT